MRAKKYAGVVAVEQGKGLYVDGPYNTEFVDRARKLKGKWHRKSREWVFDLRDREQVYAMLEDVYGTSESRVRLRLRAKAEIRMACRTGLELAGIPLATAPSSNGCDAHLSDRVLLVGGRVRASEPSEEWALVIEAGTEIEIKDYPGHRVDEVPDGWEVVSAALDPYPRPVRPPRPEPDPETWDQVTSRLCALESRVADLERIKQSQASQSETV